MKDPYIPLPADAKVTTVNLAALEAAPSVGVKLPENDLSPERLPRGDGTGQTQKYGNRKVRADGHTFDSIKEHARYQMLRLMERAGAISGLTVHPTFVLCVNEFKVCKMIPDFAYVYNETGERVVEDVKSEATRKKESYRLKKRLLFCCLGIKIREIL